MTSVGSEVERWRKRTFVRSVPGAEMKDSLGIILQSNCELKSSALLFQQVGSCEEQIWGLRPGSAQLQPRTEEEQGRYIPCCLIPDTFQPSYAPL